MKANKLFHPFHSNKFRYRSEEILRVEALSDAVFAFSVSLLVASLEVPQTFSELKHIILAAIPFFATVAILFLLWYRQYVFFRHYALNDLPTILLNLAYIAVILFYVYPLKFLFSLLIASWTGIDLFPQATEKGLPVILQQDFSLLIIIFSAGYCTIWILLYLMHRQALHFKNRLDLNTYELLYTLKEKRGALWNAFIGVLAITFALLHAELLAGASYLLIPFLLITNEALLRQKLIKRGKGTTAKMHPDLTF